MQVAPEVSAHGNMPSISVTVMGFLCFVGLQWMSCVVAWCRRIGTCVICCCLACCGAGTQERQGVPCLS